MWGMFFAAVVLVGCFLYIPGFFALRAFCISRIFALVCAPLLSLVVYSLLGIVYAKVGIFCSWVVLVLPYGVLAFAVWGISRFFKGSPKLAFEVESSIVFSKKPVWHFDASCLLGYVVLGLAVSLIFLSGSLSGPDAYVQEFDNVQHLGLTRGFVESGNWSALGVSMYPSEAGTRINPLPGSGFYPTAWNCVAALAVSALQVSVPLAINATNFLFVGIVLPASMFLLMRVLFRDRLSAIPFGAFCVLGFTAFPWGFLMFGPLYPNLAAFCLVPAVAACFVSVFTRNASNGSRVAAGLLCVIGLICLAFSQPNAVFTLAVFLIPFCTVQASRLADLPFVPDERKLLVRVGSGLAFLVFAGFVWFALYKMPFMQSVVTHYWSGFSTGERAVFDAFSLAFRLQVPQFLLALAVLAGIVSAARSKVWFWMAFPFVIFCIFFIIDATDGMAKHLLTGFWYTDSYRIAASAALVAVPLASLGLWWASKGLQFLVVKLRDVSPERASAVSAALVAAVFLLGNFAVVPAAQERGVPGSAFGAVSSVLSRMSKQADQPVYSNAESAFVQEAMKVIPEGALVVNEPDDGSAFAYGVDGLNVYYRNLRDYGGANETKDSVAIRTKLYRVVDDVQVQAALEDIGAKYVLKLDQGPSIEQRGFLFTYEDGKRWSGLEGLNDNTPGFEVVLSRDDMRLYKVVAA